MLADRESVREVAAAPTAAAQGGERGRLHRKSEGVGGGVTNQLIGEL